MAVQAAVTLYRKQVVALFETRKALLGTATTKEFMSNGQSAVFLVSGSDGGVAVTRGQNGDIPYGVGSNTQVTATLVEKHAAEALTGFDVFASQGDQTAQMKKNTLAKINREIDLQVLGELANATQDFGTGVLTLETILGCKAILGNASVDTEDADNLFCVISPAAEAYMLQMTEFSSSDYVDVKPLSGGPVRKYRRWAGINWIVSNLVTGVGTSSELLYMWHRDALGYACNMSEAMVDADFNREQQRSWSLATIYHKAKILQNTGIIKITHDGSAFVAT